MSERVADIAFDATVVTSVGAVPVRSSCCPCEASTIFGTRARVPVRATFNGVPYRGSAMPIGDGRFGLGLTKAIRSAGRGSRSATPSTSWCDATPRNEPSTSPTTSHGLRAAGLADRFAALAYSHRREYVAWVTGAKRAETRAKQGGQDRRHGARGPGAFVTDAPELAREVVGRPARA